jgi:protein-disulfide isomerase
MPVPPLGGRRPTIRPGPHRSNSDTKVTHVTRVSGEAASQGCGAGRAGLLCYAHMRLVTPLILLVCVVPVGLQQPDPTTTRSKGRREAPVTVYEMADFQCPACREFALGTLPVIDRDYIQAGKVRWVFVNFPLASIHHNAVAAAQVAMCAARQNRFWAMHDALYLRQSDWAALTQPMPVLTAIADSVGVRHDSLVSCVNSRATLDQITQDAQGSMRAGANATPSFYIEGGLAQGAIPAQAFAQILDSIYRAKTGAPAASAAPPPSRP